MPRTAEPSLPAPAAEPAVPPTASASATGVTRVRQLIDGLSPSVLEILEPLLERLSLQPDPAADDDPATLRFRELKTYPLPPEAHPLALAVEDNGGVLSPLAACQALGVSRQAIYNQRRERRILALRSGGRFVYPWVQFVSDEGATAGRLLVHPDLRAILAAGAMFTPTELFMLLATPQAAFHGATGWDLMHDGMASTVVRFLDFMRGGTDPDVGDAVADLPVDVEPATDGAILFKETLPPHRVGPPGRASRIIAHVDLEADVKKKRSHVAGRGRVRVHFGGQVTVEREVDDQLSKDAPSVPDDLQGKDDRSSIG